MPWFWNDAAGRYQWRNGSARFISRATVLRYVDESLAASTDVARTLATLVSDGALSPTDFRNAFREEIKREYIRQYLLGIGGREQMTQADWGSVGGMLREQYRWLDGFVGDIATGELSEGQIAARARMYCNSAREAYERANERVFIGLGYEEVKWVITPGVENCPDCLALAGMGWQNIEDDPFDGATPGSGATQCLTNCACHLEYRKGE